MCGVRMTLRSFVGARGSVGRATPGDVEHRSGREGTVFGREPADEGGDLLDLDEPPYRDLREHVVDVLLTDLVEDRGLRRRRRHAVHGHPGLGELLAERLGERDYARLRGRVRTRVRVALLARDRGDADDPTVLSL